MAGKEGLPEWVQRTFGSETTTAAAEATVEGDGVVEGVAEMVRERIVPLEASFGDEGILWFPSLLEPDLMMILPMAFSFLTFANVEVLPPFLLPKIFNIISRHADAIPPTPSGDSQPTYCHERPQVLIVGCISVDSLPACSIISFIVSVLFVSLMCV